VTNGRTSGRGPKHLSFKMIRYDKASQSFALYVTEARAVNSGLELHPIGWVRQQDILSDLLLIHHADPSSLINVRARDTLTAGKPAASLTSDTNPLGCAPFR